jgi:phospholipid/cholesterol/gamma-HCH transport system substrate-binding protein
MSTTAQKRFRQRELRVLALIVVGLLLLGYGVYRVGKIFDVFAERYTLVTLLPSVAGLREGASVALAGRQVGQVDRIDFIPMRMKTDSNHLRVTLKVAEGVQEQIRRDSRVVIRPQGLLGDKYIDIQPGTLLSPVLAQGDTIPAESALDMEQFLSRASLAMDQVVEVVQDLGAITAPLARGEGTIGQLLQDEQLYARLVATTGEMQGLLGRINRGDGALGRMVRDPELYNQMVSAMARIDSLGGAILYGQGSLSKLITSDSLYRGLTGTVTKADNAASELAAMLQRLNRTDGTLNRMMTDPRLFDEFLKAVIDMQTLITDVRENPKKYAPPINVDVF